MPTVRDVCCTLCFTVRYEKKKKIQVKFCSYMLLHQRQWSYGLGYTKVYLRCDRKIIITAPYVARTVN